MWTHHQDLHVFSDTILPGEAEDVREVKGEVNDAAAGCCQVGPVEEDAEEETLHDGGRGESEQKEEEDEGVAVVQDSPSLQVRDGETERDTRGILCDYNIMYTYNNTIYTFEYQEIWTNAF